eukprot:TRINITY_DN6179_c0_g2_i1.p1 TRINITY_DN6179_c0_g2~~TRINITY_DN6179_c0_g2_i1.p1  ORF type:complete len:331 (-),score=59.82 TRINITY_DN6179_c0_g2_i1:974-1966(-)
MADTAKYDLNGDGTIDVNEYETAQQTEDLSAKVLEYAREHLGSGKDVDDTLDNQKYGQIPGVEQRHKWGLDPTRGTPLQVCAAVAGSAEACRLLIDNGADINFCLPENGRAGAPPLFHAIKTGDICLVKTFLEQGADRSIRFNLLGDKGSEMDCVQYARYLADQNGDQQLMCLSRLVEYYSMPFGPVSKPTLANSFDVIEADGPLAFVQGHIGAGYDINDMYSGKKWALPRFTLLACVVEAGSLPAVRFLIAAGADVNRLNEQFGGPLHFAVQNGDVHMCKVLLDSGADKNSKTTEAHALSALEYAASLAATDPSRRHVQSLIQYHNYNQ